MRVQPVPPHHLRTVAQVSATLITIVLANACGTDRPDPTGLNARGDASRGLPFVEGLASPFWQQVARDDVSVAAFAPTTAARAYPILSVAQYLAVQEAEAAIGDPSVQPSSNGNGLGAGGRPRLETDRGAVAGASAVTLSYLFQNRATSFDHTVAALENAVNPGPQRAAFLAGEAIGRAVGALIVTRAMGDHFDAAVTARPPIGPGFWISNTDPTFSIAGGSLPGTLTWFLTSPSQFRPGPPPTFGFQDFNTDLQEVRHISDTRTPEQIHIAAIWALNAGTPTAAGFWLARAGDEIVSHGLSEREATHVYALTSATMIDATIACWDAKMTYWLIRPWKADAAITTTVDVGKPNHPSYPSGHSCVSSSGGEILSTFFPERRTDFEAMVAEAGNSRIYGGIHYRFDIVAGQALGRAVANFTIAADRSGNSILTPH
jgi:membrane-associated phospholipid phosphatase